MESFQKKLFSSNLGLAGMHDKYITIPKKIDPLQFFGAPPKNIIVQDNKGNNYTLPFNKEANGEYRLARLGDFYDLFNAKPDDTIEIEKHLNSSETIYKIFLLKK